MAKHVTKAAPGMAGVLFENAKVRVIELNVKKGGKAEMHTHPTYFAYAITPLNYRETTPEGKKNLHKMKKSQVDWHDGESHAVDFLNTGRALVVELK